MDLSRSAKAAPTLAVCSTLQLSRTSGECRMQAVMLTHDQSIQQQFDPRAEAYLTSAVHAAGPDLEAAKALLARSIPAAARAIDIGCGAGHLSFALAPMVASMTAVDPS